MINKDNELKLYSFLNKYNLNEKEQDELKKVILPFFNHCEFQRRMTKEFSHHDDITLGEHILEDSVLTYILSKKYLQKKKNYRLDLAIKIAMMHDLYTIPWQNNQDAKVKHFFNKHGFRHPVEAVINGITWYPEMFQNMEDANIIIDGILHHMFPLPVRTLNQEIKKIELKNENNFNKLASDYKAMIFNSLKRKKIGNISFTRSKYLEGRIMAKADRIISRKQINNFASAKALLTGHNKKLKK